MILKPLSLGARINPWPVAPRTPVSAVHTTVGAGCADRQCSAPRQGWSQGSEETIPSCNVVGRPAGAQPVRPRGSPPAPVASLATLPARWAARRRQANVGAMGHAAPHPLPCPAAQGAACPAGPHSFAGRWARRGPSPAGCATMARPTRTAQAPGRPASCRATSGRAGRRGPVSDARPVGGPTRRRP